MQVEIHHKSVPQAGAGDDVGVNVKGLTKENMPKVGDKDGKGGFTPSIHVRTAKAPCRLSKIHFKMGKKSTGGTKMENPDYCEANDRVFLTFEPKMPLYLESFANCPELGRVAVMDSNKLVMLGQVKNVKGTMTDRVQIKIKSYDYFIKCLINKLLKYI